MRTSPVLAYVPLFLVGCGESSIQSSPSTASQEPAPRPTTPLVVDSDASLMKQGHVWVVHPLNGLPLKLWQAGLLPAQREDFRKALDELTPPRDPWLGLPGWDIPGPNYDRWDMRPDRDSRGRPARGW